MRNAAFLGLIVTFSFCLAISTHVYSQLPAQKGIPGKGNRPTMAPEGKTSTSEPDRAPKDHKLTKVGTPLAVAPVGNDINYKIGVNGYKSDSGFVVLSTVTLRDKDKNKNRSPAREIFTDFQGNGKIIEVKLEAGDKITAIGGYDIKSEMDIIVAVNSSNNPNNLDITCIDWRTGNEYSGKINAARVK